MVAARQKLRILEAQTRSMALALRPWILRLVGRMKPNAGWTVIKAWVPDTGILYDEFQDELTRILWAYGLRIATDNYNDGASREILKPGMVRAALAGKDIRIKLFQALQDGLPVRVDLVTERTKTAILDYVRKVGTDAMLEHPQPSVGEVARRIQAMMIKPEGDPRFFAFTSERAAVIARTEVGQAQALGYFQGIVDTSDDADEMEWGSWPGGGRSHEKVNGKRITVGDMRGSDESRWFEIPDTIAKTGRIIPGCRIPYPRYADGPPRHIIQCRCFTRILSRKVRDRS